LKDKIQMIALRYAMTHYGNLVRINDDYITDYDNRRYIFTLRFDAPYIENIDGERKIRVFKINDVGKLYIDMDTLMVDERLSTDRKTVNVRISTEMARHGHN